MDGLGLLVVAWGDWGGGGGGGGGGGLATLKRLPVLNLD